jgi:hypothetical protein
VSPHMTGVRIEAIRETGRVIHVNRQALALFNRIGLVPPDVGQFGMADLDAKLDARAFSQRNGCRSKRTCVTADC